MPSSHSNHWTTDPEYIDLVNYFIEKAKDVKSPISIHPLAREYKEKSGAEQTVRCLESRVYNLRSKIHTFAHIDTNTKVKLLFALSASVDAKFLEELKKDALVEVDEKNRITHYKATDRSLKLRGDQSLSAKNRTAKLVSKQSIRSWIIDYFENKNDANAVPKNEETNEMWNLIEWITKKCENVDSPQNITRVAKDFVEECGIARASLTIRYRLHTYCREIQTLEFLDTHSKVKQLFCLSVKLNSDCLEKLRKTAVVEVDQKNRIIKYTANDGSLTLQGSHWGSGETTPERVKKTNKDNVATTADDSEEESDNERFNDSSEEHSSEECDGEFDSDDGNNDSEVAEDLVKSTNEAVDFDNETPIGNRSPTKMSIDDNFDFDPPTERSHVSEETEMREDVDFDSRITENAAVQPQRFETLRKSQTSSSKSHSFETPKRKADESAGSTSSKRTKPSSDKSMKPGEMNDNFSHDDPSRVELKPFRGPLGPPNEIQEDSDIQQIPNPYPQVMKAPIKQENEEETQTSLKMVLNSFKSLILGLDTTGLSQLRMELDTKIEKTGRRVEISNKELIMAMELLIVKLSKHGALKSSEEAFSLHDILLILRTIILNSSFKGLEDILKMLKENIDQLKDLDKKVPVSKVDSVLRATIESIST